MKPLDGKVAIVTGAGHPRGMGQAASLRLAEHGAAVVLTDLAKGEDDDALRGLRKGVRHIEAGGGKAMAMAVDVTRRADIEDCVARTLTAFGGIDILFNNAGTPVGAGAFLDMTDAQWDMSYEVNVRGPALFCRAVIPHMIERGGGSIINNASVAGLGAIPFMAAYTATKFAVVGLTKAIATEFGHHNVRCNAICPGSIKTAMYDLEATHIAERRGITVEEAKRSLDEEGWMKRSAEPGEVADVVAYLAGPASSFITGVALPVAGGMAPGL